MAQNRPMTRDQPGTLNLSGASRKRLVAALLAAFDRAGFEQLARFHLNEDFEEIASEGNLRLMAFSLVEWAANHGRLPDLVTGALAENPENPELQAFASDVWARALAGDPTVLEPPDDVPAVPAADGRLRAPVLAAGLVAIIALAGIAWFALGNRGGADPNGRPTAADQGSRLVALSDAALSARTTGADNQDVFDVGFRIKLDNFENASVVVEGHAYDAETLQPINLGDATPPQRFRPDLPSEEVRSTLRFPFTRAPRCMFVRVVAFDGSGYPETKVELTQTRTPAFNPWHPENPSCPQEGT